MRDILPRTLACLRQGAGQKLHWGAQLYVSLRGERLADLALGEARPGVPMQTGFLLPWLSAGKPLAALAIAQLYERGLLDLDDSISTVIPEFALHGKEAVTVRHLLTHTGGFRPADKIPEFLGWSETIEQICKTPLEMNWVPGRKAGYHVSSSWFVLGEIVERLTNQSFSDYLRHNILEPIGMLDSWMVMRPDQFEAAAPRLGKMFQAEKGQLEEIVSWNSPQIARLSRPGSGLRGPVRELGFLYEALLNGGERLGNRILQADTVRLFTARHRVSMFDQTFRHVMDWGLGFLLNSNRYGVDTVPYGYGPHASEETFGHSGSQSSCAFADPRHGLAVAWVCNGRPGERRHQLRARELHRALYEDLKLRLE